MKVTDWRPKRAEWVEFIDVIAEEVGPSPLISQWEAERILRKLCAGGVIQAIRVHEDGDGIEFIPTAEWKRADFDTYGVYLSIKDLHRHSWELQNKPVPEAGKQPRIRALLAELFPGGVPDPGHCPRKALKADLLRRDQSLNPLDEATLKSAIDAYNSSLG
jgi:hypothetical protein